MQKHKCRLEHLIRVRYDKVKCRVCGFTGFLTAPKEIFWKIGQGG